MDLCVYSEDPRVYDTASSLGFSLVAFTKQVSSNFDLNSLKFPTLKHDRLLVLNRLTVAVSHPSQIAQLATIDRSAIDLLAIRPSNDQVLKTLLEKCPPNFQIISLDLSQPLLTTSMRAGMKKLISQGIFFEIEFSSVLRDTTARGICVNQCRLVLNTFASGVLLSSGARNALELRSSFDLDLFAQGVLGLRGSPSKSADFLVRRALKMEDKDIH